MSGDPSSNLTPEADTSEHTRPLWPLPPGVDEEALKRLRHDLRTPLNQIIGYTEMLIETAAEGGSTTLAEDLQHLHASGSQILALLNEGLAQWKVEAGKVDLIALRRSLLGPLNGVLGYRDLCE
jgi:adenylate cyclase